MVVKNLPEYLLRVHLQTRCRLGELKGVKYESAKMKKQQRQPNPNPNYNANPNPILTITLKLTALL